MSWDYRRGRRTDEEAKRDLKTGTEREIVLMGQLSGAVNTSDTIHYILDYRARSGTEINTTFFRNNGDIAAVVTDTNTKKSARLTLEIKANDKNDDGKFRLKSRDLEKCVSNNWPALYFHLKRGTMSGKFIYFSIPDIQNILRTHLEEKIYQYDGKPGFVENIANYSGWIDNETLMSEKSGTHDLINKILKQLMSYGKEVKEVELAEFRLYADIEDMFRQHKINVRKSLTSKPKINFMRDFIVNQVVKKHKDVNAKIIKSFVEETLNEMSSKLVLNLD